MGGQAHVMKRMARLDEHPAMQQEMPMSSCSNLGRLCGSVQPGKVKVLLSEHLETNSSGVRQTTPEKQSAAFHKMGPSNLQLIPPVANHCKSPPLRLCQSLQRTDPVIFNVWWPIATSVVPNLMMMMMRGSARIAVLGGGSPDSTAS